MYSIDNNQFEVVPAKSKRKIVPPCPNVYLNPALDLLVNEDPMCNTAMELVPVKKRKRSRSCEIVAFENSALDIGISKAAVNEFLAKELENVCKNVRTIGAELSSHSSRPKTSLSQTSVSESNITLCTPYNYMHPIPIFQSNETKPIATEISCSIDAQSSNGKTEPIYANLAENDQNIPSNVTIPATEAKMPLEIPYVGNAIASIPISADCIGDNMSITAADSNIDNATSIQNCTEVSKINNATEFSSDMSLNGPKYLSTNLEHNDISAIQSTNIQANITNQIFVNNQSNLSLSFIDRLALDSPNFSNQSLIFDDDLNESNIMEIKTITIITKKRRLSDKKKNTNPFLDPTLKLSPDLEESDNTTVGNIFVDTNETSKEMEYNDEVCNGIVQVPSGTVIPIQPRRLFNNTNSTFSTVNDSLDQHEYENIDGYRSESPIYENVGEMCDNFNKQSKILGQDVSQFSAVDIMNLNKNSKINSSNESSDSKRDLKHQILKASNKLSKKVFKTLKKTFRGDKHSTVGHDSTLNPYEIPRKPPKDKTVASESGIENPALNLDNSDIEIEVIDDEDVEHQYESIKTLRNTRLNMNVTPLRERTLENMDSSHNKTNTPGKKVRFDSTLNQEKIITGNSFNHDIQSPGFDSKLEKYHDELENCMNERKYLQQNM